MKVTLLCVILSLAVANAAVVVPLLHGESSTKIDGQYIFVFRSDLAQSERSKHLSELRGQQSFGNKVNNVFEIGNFTGFTGKFNSSYINILRQNNHLYEFIEHDQVVRAVQSCQQQTNAVWGLNRISERKVNLNSLYRYGSTAGQGVTAFIVDTGINMKHVEFTGRVKWGANYADKTDDDCNGHGTHVAGTVGGTTYGVAKKVELVAVKVLDCEGSGTNAGVISGIDYVAKEHSSKKLSVANMSLGGGKSTALNNAVKNAVNAGVTFVVAAGNENQDACNTSPASEKSAITVGATTIDDESVVEKDARAYFSNYGTCVDILAPGELIKSAWIGSSTAVNTISGTSMASPHVAGAAALYLATRPTASPEAVSAHLISASTSGSLDMVCTGSSTAKAACGQTPNYLLYSAC